MWVMWLVALTMLKIRQIFPRFAMIRHHGSFEFGIDLTIESKVFCIGKNGETLERLHGK
jgi:hypothetical protein